MTKNKTFKKFFLYFGLIVIAVITIFPLLWGISSSLRPDVEIFKNMTPLSWKTFIPENPSLNSYIELFTKFNFFQPILNTLLVAIISILFGCLVNSIAAFSFATFDFKYKKLLFGIIFVSFMIPFESIALPLYKVVDQLNWVNTFAGIIVPGIADGLVLFLFTQFFKDLPPSLIEAARVDGAGWPTIFTKIIFPLSIPVFVTAGLMIFMAHWNSYLWPLVIARSPEIRMVQVALSDFQQERVTLWSNLYAASMISAFIPVLLFLPFQKYYVQGITNTGIKG